MYKYNQYTGRLTYEQAVEKFKQLNQLKQVKMKQAKTIKAIFKGQIGCYKVNYLKVTSQKKNQKFKNRLGGKKFTQKDI